MSSKRPYPATLLILALALLLAGAQAGSIGKVVSLEGRSKDLSDSAYFPAGTQGTIVGETRFGDRTILEIKPLGTEKARGSQTVYLDQSETEPKEKAPPQPATQSNTKIGSQEQCLNINMPDLNQPAHRSIPGNNLPADWLNGVGSGQATEGSAATGRTPASTADGPAAPMPPTSYVGNSTSPIETRAGNLVDNVAAAERLATQAGRQEIVQLARSAVEANQRAAQSDQAELARPYRNLSAEQLGDYLSRAKKSLTEAASDLDSAVAGLEKSEQSRFKNLFLNARDKASFGMEALAQNEAQQEGFGDLSPFGKLNAPGAKPNPLARNQELAELFGAQLPEGAAATSQDALINRVLMQHGLPAAQRGKISKALALSEPIQIELPDGRKKDMDLLHNGYLLGGGKSAMDCSSFVSAMLPAEVRKGRFTTMDFYSMWYFRQLGSMPNPPKNSPEWGRLVKDTAMAFDPINLYARQQLAPGDLLVYRIPVEPIGHVFIVKKYDAQRQVAEVIEAAQSAGGLREREFPLSLDPPDVKDRAIRAGLFGLRIRPTNQKVCRYAADPKESQGSGGLR